MTANATFGRLLTQVRGRSGRSWEPRTVQLRPGQLRSSGANALRATRLVKDADDEAYGALRFFPSVKDRGRAAALLAAGSPVTPPLVDVVDHPQLPPALITAWAPGNESVPLHALRDRDDLGAMLAGGHRWAPAAALRTLVPLGRALDDMARAGFVPVELSPDHLVVNFGSVVLAGIGRHGYLPHEGRMPGAQGMSLPSALLLGGDTPSAGSGDQALAQWREVQLRALIRLAGWMACGLPPGAWGPVDGPADLYGYLEAAGFQRVPTLRPGRLADTLARAAQDEEQARARADLAGAEALLVYDDTAQSRGGDRLSINPESLRLGLLHEHGPNVIAVAAFDQRRLSTRGATLLSGAGWVLVRPDELVNLACRIASAAPHARVVVAGRTTAGALRSLQRVRGAGVEQVDWDDLSIPSPQIAGMAADRLPFATDPNLEEYYEQVLDSRGGAARRRRTFAAGWTLRLGGVDRVMRPAPRAALLERLADSFGTDTELLVAVRSLQNAPGLRRQNRLQDEAGLRRLVTALSGVPRSVFRECLMSALLGPAERDVYDEAARRLLPVAGRLADVFDPRQEVGADGLTMATALQELEGIRRVGLYGRLCTAVPEVAPERLAAAVAGMDDPLVSLLSQIPAPSLQFLVGRLDDPQLLDLLRPHLHGEDQDLLARYTPQMWRRLLDGLRQPEHLTALGLGWVQIVDQDTARTVDARVLLQIATDANVTGRDAVRALLGTAPAGWPAVCAHPTLAARWLSEQGDLDIAEIAERFPDTRAALAELGTEGLRHALELGLNQRAMTRLNAYADGVGHPLSDVIAAFKERGYETVEHTEPLGTAAAVAWSRWQLDLGNELDWVIGNVVQRPERIRDWAVNGPRLTDRVGAAVLAPGASTEALEADPVLLPLLATLAGPAQRTALLHLYAADPKGTLEPRARRELPLILAADDPPLALHTLLRDGLGVVAQQYAERLGLSPELRRVLAELEPLASRLALRSLEAVLSVGARWGTRVAVTAAVVEQRLPGSAEAVNLWGPRWLPLLAGRSGQRVLWLLTEQGEKHSRHTDRLTPWLLAAGDDGLRLVERYGSDALDLVLATGAAPSGARLLGELLTLPGPGPVLYRLITENGLPPQTWRRAARLLSRGEQPERVLLRLWSSTPVR
ncbi:hypothetical protein ACWCPF_09310 [Streptomyces sp. NPDC001858]